GQDTEGKTVFDARPVQGEDIVGVLPRPWSGDDATDTQREAQMLGGFFQRVVESIQSFCSEGRAPVHFYVWARSEITRLVEACARADTDLLGSLRELLGCRESLEQLMYSCLGDEIDHRYALGWTGRSLGAAVSLPWFGRRFHWTRRVGDEDVALDRAFRQGVFDFKTTLKFDDAGHWLPLDAEDSLRHPFEVRACFQDALPAPYWRAYWNTLPDPDAPGMDAKTRAGIRAYGEGGKPGYLKAYLKARGQALRWIEESVKFKNSEIAKPPVDVRTLPTFTLGVGSAARAALDFLWLEQHVATNDWMAARLIPPAGRVATGRTLPLRDVKATAPNKLSAAIDLDGCPLDAPALEARCGLAPGAFVRLSPCADDPQKGQTVAQIVRGGSTCILDEIDWETGQVALSVMPFTGRENRYILPSCSWPVGGKGYSRATLDESLSDFVAGKIDARLQSGLGAHVYRWFDPQDAQIPPQTPLPPSIIAQYRALLSQLDLGNGPLAPDQITAAIDGLSGRVQLLQGPPGTGKTQTTAAATLLRILARRAVGDVVLVAANTHTAVDTLLRRLAALGPRFDLGATQAGLPPPPVRLSKVHSKLPDTPTGNDIEDFTTNSGAGFVAVKRLDSVLVLGGTPNALLKLAKELGRSAPFSHDPQGFQAPVLIVDEASMMVLPTFLALASLVREDGEILLAGDHRQLA
nr:AAA family ATPase [Armatimonadota bacterium]